jgi:hypothetical protein
MLIEPAHQCVERSICNRLVPMVQRGVEDRLATHEADHRAEDDRHPEQRREAPGKADAAEGGKAEQDDQPHEKANQHLAGIELLRKMRKLRQDQRLRRS